MTQEQRLEAVVQAIGADSKLALKTAGRQFRAFTDCIANVNTPDFSHTVSGTGAAFSSLAVGTDNAVGLLRAALGTIATNRASIASPNLNCILFGKGQACFAAKVRFPTLSDLTNTYTFRAGFINSITAESSNGVFFRYTNAIGSGVFQAVTRSNNVETAANTTVTAAANTFYNFEINVNAAGTSAEFKINGAVVATITTNIPTAAGRETGYGKLTLRSLGVLAVNSDDTDFIEVLYNFTTAR